MTLVPHRMPNVVALPRRGFAPRTNACLTAR